MNPVTRRHFVQWLLGLPFLAAPLFSVRKGETDPSLEARTERTSIGQFFGGEELDYEIGLWIFKRVAVGKVSFRAMEKGGMYLSTLQAWTLGVMGWVARYRVDTYRSIMEMTDEGRRLRSLSFEEEVKIGNRLRKKTHRFDYERQRWIVSRLRKDGTMETKEARIPEGMVYDDFLTASYNFRYGVYGPIERGRTYRVATFPRKGATSYEVRIADRAKEEKRRRSEPSKEGKDFFIELFLDPELTHSKEGLIEGWLSTALYPTEGAIKDVILLGDVKGTLVKIIRSSSSGGRRHGKTSEMIREG